MPYKPVLKQESPLHYVSDARMIEFIVQNSNMQWNPVCDFVRKVGICSDSGEPVLWEKDEIVNSPKAYTEEQVKWVGAFFEAHPWIERMMLTFDD